MFDETMWVAKGKTRRAWTVPASFAGQVVVVGLAVLTPLVFTERLKLGPMTMAAPVRYGGHHRPKPEHVKLVRTPVRPTPGTYTAPASIPRGVARVVDPPTSVADQPTGPECPEPCFYGDLRVLPAGPLVPGSEVLPPPPPVHEHAVAKPPAQPPATPARLRIGGNIQAGKLISRVEPVYPPLAVQTRTSGVVELAAVIGTDGRVRELKVLSGHPLLVRAALDAVRNWVYAPTTLNGDPVEVATWISVSFKLGAQ